MVVLKFEWVRKRGWIISHQGLANQLQEALLRAGLGLSPRTESMEASKAKGSLELRWVLFHHKKYTIRSYAEMHLLVCRLSDSIHVHVTLA